MIEPLTCTTLQTNSPSAIQLWVLALLFGVVCLTHAERTVNLEWNPVTNGSITGYRIYCLEEGATEPVQIDVGSATSTTMGGLKEGLGYTFTVTAYNEQGRESTPSTPAKIVVPVPVQLVRPSTPTAIKRIRFPVAPGRSYEIQASVDLRNWTTIWQTGIATTYTWLEVPDLQSGSLKQRYYRLKVITPATP